MSVDGNGGCGGSSDHTLPLDSVPVTLTPFFRSRKCQSPRNSTHFIHFTTKLRCHRYTSAD
eukprot:scaffold39193_cov152-Skeletonema_marinoi.AAC.1